jgi:hypothetical protein
MWRDFVVMQVIKSAAAMVREWQHKLAGIPSKDNCLARGKGHVFCKFLREPVLKPIMNLTGPAMSRRCNLRDK